MSEDLSTAVGRRQALTRLVDTLRSLLKPGQAEQVMTCLGAGEWRLALEFLLDYIIDEEIPVSSATFAEIDALGRALGTDRGIAYIEENLVLD